MMGQLHFLLKKGNYDSLLYLDVKHLKLTIDFLIFLYYNYIVKKKGVESMNEHQVIPFNHGRLCEMLRAASDKELANVINDVKKVQEQRKNAREEILITNLKTAINAIIDAGYYINISTMDDPHNPDCVIHSNNRFCTMLTISNDNEEDE